MSANLTEEHHEMLRVLLEKGGDKAPVRWIRLALRVKGAGQLLVDLTTSGHTTMSDKGAPNPGFQLTAAGITEARKGAS